MTENVMEQAADPDVEVSKGQLVWYNERKGYGFVRIGEEEIFLHRSTLDRFGLVRLLNGDRVAEHELTWARDQGPAVGPARGGSRPAGRLGTGRG